MSKCRLCGYAKASSFAKWKSNEYERCPTCKLIQLNVDQLPNEESELQEYRLHNNDPIDKGYRRFLSKVTIPTLHWLTQQKEKGREIRILDFGSGPIPAMANILAEQGWQVDNYDPFFAPDQMLLTQQYDLIICTEVVEHFHDPTESWNVMLSCLKPSGKLIVMTSACDQKSHEEAFVSWSYIRETSHVAFYHGQTMEWIATHNQMKLSRLHDHVFWFEKQSPMIT